jgi:pilus assembly protein CpaE
MLAPGDDAVLLICPDRSLAVELADLLSKEIPLVKAVDWTAYPQPSVLEKLAGSVRLSMCFLDASTDREQALRVLSESPNLWPKLPLVVLLADHNPEIVLRCLRQGASGFLLRPFTSDQLRLVLQRIAGRQPASSEPAPPNGRVHCVMPSKGACGATTIAVNLAWQARRLGAKRVLLADMDPLTSPLSFLLKLKSQYSFVDALMHSANLDQDLWKALVTSYQGVDVLLAPESPVDDTIDGHDVGALIDYARRNYDAVILDTGGPYGKWSARLAALSDEILLVTTTELSPLHAAQRVIAHLEDSGIARSRIRVLVNCQRKNYGIDLEDVATVLGLPVFHVVPQDSQAIDNALINGKAVADDTQFARSLAALISRLSGREPETGKSSTLKSLLSRFAR